MNTRTAPEAAVTDPDRAADTVRAHLSLPGMTNTTIMLSRVDGRAPERVDQVHTIGSDERVRTWVLVHDGGDTAVYHFESDHATSSPRRHGSYVSR